MPKCDACGNDYDKSFQVIAANKSYTFDSFECAISTLAPTCAHCKVRIVGHGLEKSGHILLQPLRRAGGGDGTARSIIATATCCSLAPSPTKMPAKCVKRSAGPFNHWAWLRPSFVALCRRACAGLICTASYQPIGRVFAS